MRLSETLPELDILQTSSSESPSFSEVNCFMFKFKRDGASQVLREICGKFSSSSIWLNYGAPLGMYFASIETQGTEKAERHSKNSRPEI